MAHHVAELIGAAETAPSGKVKRERSKEAFEAILSLWSHRSTYENRINPLFELKPIIQVLGTLDPSKNEYLLRNEGTRYVYDIFRRLMICLLFRKAESLTQVSQALSGAKVTSKFQSNDEREIVAALDFWLEGALTRETAKTHHRSSKAAKVERIDLDDTAQTLIAEARKALDEVAEEIAQRHTKRTSARPLKK